MNAIVSVISLRRARPYLPRASLVVSIMLFAAASVACAQSSPDDPACHPPPAPAGLTAHASLAPADEPGERMTLRVRIEDTHGIALRGVVVYSYHTNARGLYPKRGGETGCSRWHGYLHGWARTDSSGSVTFATIRPAPYPNDRSPAHVHLVMQFAGAQGFYVNDVTFTDDPLVNDAYRRSEQTLGGSGIVTPVRRANGTWEVARTIRLPRPVRPTDR